MLVTVCSRPLTGATAGTLAHTLEEEKAEESPSDDLEPGVAKLLGFLAPQEFPCDHLWPGVAEVLGFGALPVSEGSDRSITIDVLSTLVLASWVRSIGHVKLFQATVAAEYWCRTGVGTESNHVHPPN